MFNRFWVLLLLPVMVHSQIMSTNDLPRDALIIGNASYEEGRLRNPVNDATDINSTLKTMNFRTILLTDASRSEMREAIRTFAKRLRKGGIGLFYYAGHGLQIKGINYLVPIGAKIENEYEVEDEALRVDAVLRAMENAGNSMNMIFLDACRNNPFKKSFYSHNRGSENMGLAQMNAPTGSLIVYATAPGSVASDGAGRNGVYTKNLLNFIQRPGVEVGRLLRQVRVGVKRDTDGIQVPWESSSLEGDFYFVLPSKPNPKNSTVPSTVKKDISTVATPPKEIVPPKEDIPVLDIQPTPEVQPKNVVTSSESEIAGFQFLGEKEYQQGSNTNKIKEYLHLKTGLEFVLVPAGKFTMDAFHSKSKKREINVTSFLMSKTEVTQEAWHKIFPDQDLSKSNYMKQGAKYPLALVSWNHAQSMAKAAGLSLPSEAQWEYACRAGSTTQYPWGDKADERYLWYSPNTYWKNLRTPQEVGQKLPNGFGLHDMLGNVSEWCLDSYQTSEQSPPKDEKPWIIRDNRLKRVRKGGSFIDRKQDVSPSSRSSYDRDGDSYFLGVRLCYNFKSLVTPRKTTVVEKASQVPVIPGFAYYQTVRHQDADLTKTVREYKHLKTGLDFVLIPEGQYTIGNNKYSPARPTRTIQVPAFLMAKYETPVYAWNIVMEDSPLPKMSSFEYEDNHPVANVTWRKAKEMATRLGLNLPSEAQWEYACRAGVDDKYYWGNKFDPEYCWISSTTQMHTKYAHAIGQKKPNVFGLYDMLGNVSEWCEDSYQENYENALSDVKPWILAENRHQRVHRGGSYVDRESDIRVFCREKSPKKHSNTYIGFRLCYNITPLPTQENQQKVIPNDVNAPKIPGFQYLRTVEYRDLENRNTVREYLHTATQMEFVLLPGGDFTAGNLNKTTSKYLRKVKVGSFLIAKHETTQKVWEEITGEEVRETQYRTKGDDYPMSYVSWKEAKAAAEKVGLSLPSEIQWEYAARSGSTTDYYWGNRSDSDYYWHANLGLRSPAAVGQKYPNTFGLYDMVGNVSEWCLDTYSKNLEGAPNNDQPWVKSEVKSRVHRGGNYISSHRESKIHVRKDSQESTSKYTLGFRFCYRLD